MFLFIAVFCALLSGVSQGSEIGGVLQKIHDRMKNADSLVCVGLDPDFELLPEACKQECAERKIYAKTDVLAYFLKAVIDNTYQHACAYKLNSAFYSTYDNLLRSTILHIRSKCGLEMPIIVDQKIADIENTAKRWVKYFRDLGADIVTVSPYMGGDVVEAFREHQDIATAVLVRTSNPAAAEIQNFKDANGRCLWQHVLDKVVGWNANKLQCIPIFSVNRANPQDVHSVRSIISDHVPILTPGIGVQDGDINLLNLLLDKNKRGVMVNSSRGILYPRTADVENSAIWHVDIQNAASDFRNRLNKIRE
jgi:orotidine-5'-phosphate decarboxylase